MPEEQEIEQTTTEEIQEPDYREIALRAQAELENVRKRSDVERLQVIKYGNSSLIEELLPIVDNFDRAIKAVPEEQRETAWVTGLNYIRKNLLDVLEAQGVTVLSAKVGDVYDTTVQEALSSVDAPEQPEDTIVSVVSNGYRLHDRLLRPIQVIVSTHHK